MAAAGEHRGGHGANNCRIAGALHNALAFLAASPDDVSHIDTILDRIVRLTATTVQPVDYASIAARRDGTAPTVAFSNDLARAVDQAQYAGGDPCVDAVDSGAPVSVPDIAATVTWPNFRDVAGRLGLHTTSAAGSTAVQDSRSRMSDADGIMARTSPSLATAGASSYARRGGAAFLSQVLDVVMRRGRLLG